MLNGDATLADPAMLVVLVFCTVKARSIVPLTVTVPKLVDAEGVTLKSA
jgi:hypothetical protein